jgi:hypothetical protein
MSAVPLLSSRAASTASWSWKYWTTSILTYRPILSIPVTWARCWPSGRDALVSACSALPDAWAMASLVGPLVPVAVPCAVVAGTLLAGAAEPAPVAEPLPSVPPQPATSRAAARAATSLAEPGM